jgi:hypothetical protein
MQRIRFAGFLLGVAALVTECAAAQSNCKQLKGELVVVPQPGTSVGTITKGGSLSGTYTGVDSSVGFATPDPKVVSFTQDLIISTRHGQLTATSVWLFDFSNSAFLPFGAVSAIARIGPTSATTGHATSTGRFAGATGLYFLTGAGGPDAADNARAEITGQVCHP